MHCTGVAQICEHPRYQEILAHLALRDYEIDWRALDDSKNEFPDHCEQLILCGASEGLGAQQLAALKEWLFVD